jgi:hypothetical protein
MSLYKNGVPPRLVVSPSIMVMKHRLGWSVSITAYGQPRLTTPINLLSTYFLLDIAYIAALFLLKIHNLQNTMPLYEDGYQKRNKSCILAVKSGFLPELSEHLWGFS